MGEVDASTSRELTFGEKAVGLTFNPGGNPDVDECKRNFAKVIDQLHDLRTKSDSAEIKRMCSTAISTAQTAQMWGVKAITWKD